MNDAPQRNVLLTLLNYSITSTIDGLESVATKGGERKLLIHKWHIEFVQRWNLFRYKLDKSVSILSHLDFEMVLYYSRSSNHDLDAIHSLFYHTIHELEALLACFKDLSFPWDSVSISKNKWE